MNNSTKQVVGNSPQRHDGGLVCRSWRGLAAVVGVGVVLSFSGCASVSERDRDAPAVQDYPELILGKWEISSHGYVFNRDGSVLLFNPEDGEIMNRGIWALEGNRLRVDWEEFPSLQEVPIKFINLDFWVWNIGSRWEWDAVRLDSGASGS